MKEETINDIILVSKEEEAIRFLREHEPPEGYFLGFSGGKDSVVIYHLAEQAGVRFEPWYSATGIDPPELMRFIRENYPEIQWARPKTSFYEAIQKKGFPTKFSRWCCDYLKKDPTKDNPLKHRILGIRAEESWKRAKRPKIDYFKNYKQWVVYKPIFHWLEWEIWEYIDRHNLPVCSLYNEGFHRLGCVVCPFLCGKNQAALNKHKNRWPGIYKAFEHAMTRLWDDREWWRQTRKRYAMTQEEFIENWYHANQNIKKSYKPIY